MTLAAACPHKHAITLTNALKLMQMSRVYTDGMFLPNSLAVFSSCTISTHPCRELNNLLPESRWDGSIWATNKIEDILNGLDGNHTCLLALSCHVSSDPFIAKPPASSGQILWILLFTNFLRHLLLEINLFSERLVKVFLSVQDTLELYIFY